MPLDKGFSLAWVEATDGASAADAPALNEIEQAIERVSRQVASQTSLLRALSERLISVETKMTTGPGVAVAPPPDPLATIVNQPLQSAQTATGTTIVCNERIVEVPYVHRHLPYPFRGRALDVGCCESQIVLEVASLGFEAWGIDIRRPPIEFPGIKYVLGDVRKTDFANGFFDVVIACSTVEHIGLLTYENTVRDDGGDRDAIREMRRILQPTGRLILTIPCGQTSATNWYRAYDHSAILSMVGDAGFSIENEDYWLRQGFSWIPTTWNVAESVDSTGGGSVQAVACLTCVPA